MLIFLVALLSFLMIMNSTANKDNHMFSPNMGFRFAFTESELQAFNTIPEIAGGKIGTDWFSRKYFWHEFGRNPESIDKVLYAKDFKDARDWFVMIRDEITEASFWTGSGILRLDYDLYPELAKEGFSCIYVSGPVRGFFMKK